MRDGQSKRERESEREMERERKSERRSETNRETDTERLTHGQAERQTPRLANQHESRILPQSSLQAYQNKLRALGQKWSDTSR